MGFGFWVQDLVSRGVRGQGVPANESEWLQIPDPTLVRDLSLGLWVFGFRFRVRPLS